MPEYPVTSEFRAVSIILPVTDETISLERTIDVILADIKEDVCELLIIVCTHTTLESLAVIEVLKQRLGELIVVHHQSLPHLGGAVREAFDRACGSHAVMMSTDLETDPQDVKRLIAEARRRPDAIITASRWLKGGAFHGYNPVKLLANWVFQHVFSLIYATRLSDMTYGYRLFPTNLVRSIRWEELRHPFLFETVVKPLRLGVEVIEIPTVWRARVEGQSKNTFMRNFLYVKTGIRARFARKSSLLR